MISRVLGELERSGGLDLEALEFGLRDQMHKAGALILQKFVDGSDGGYRGAWLPCACGGAARFVEFRAKGVRTVLGEVTLRRAYYHCEHCHQGEIPQDRTWNVKGTSFSPGLRRVMSRIGAQESFEMGSQDLREIGGIEVDPKEVERISEQVGEELVVEEQSLCEQVFSGKVIPLPARPEVEKAYILADGTGVPVVPRETAGRHGKGPDGKARTREAKLGCVFTQTQLDDRGRPERDELSTTYVGGIQNAAEFGKILYAEVERRGLGKAKTQIVLGDGAVWIWELAAEHFPKAVQIVDLYHAREHLWCVGKALYDNQDKRLKSWVGGRLAELDRGDIPALLKALGRVATSCDKAREVVEREAEFFRKNRERMRYADFRSQGLFVGSGVVESGCKTVIGLRLKQSGMRWTVRGANAIIALRRCLLSHQWEDFWAARAAG